MARLIDADALMKKYGLDNATKYGNKTAEEQAFSYDTMFMYEIADMIEDAPTIEAEPVKHGEWRSWGKGGTYHYENYGTCSVCGEDAEIGTKHRNYCPNCGARMDGE